MRNHFIQSVSGCLALLGILLSASCSTPQYVSMWQHQSIKADGNANEWSKPLRYYDPTTKLQYTFSNDLKNLYVCIRATSEESQQKIMRGGIQLWIDTAGKGKDRTGLLFPLPETVKANDSHHERDAEAGNQRENTGGRKKFYNNHQEMELTGFKAPVGGLLPLKNIYGVEANINMDSLDILTYEALIPLRTFYKDSLTLSDSAHVFTFKIVLNGVPQMKKQKGSEPAADMGSAAGGMGGRRPGGSGGGGGGRGGASRMPENPLYETHSIKSNFRLRTQATPIVVPKKWE